MEKKLENDQPEGRVGLIGIPPGPSGGLRGIQRVKVLKSEKNALQI